MCIVRVQRLCARDLTNDHKVNLGCVADCTPPLQNNLRRLSKYEATYQTNNLKNCSVGPCQIFFSKTPTHLKLSSIVGPEL